MNVSEKRKIFKKQIDEEIANLDKSIDALNHSYGKCKKIRETKEYGLDEQEIFEALASRFARSSDILTQKVLKSLFILLQENVNTMIDSAHLLEKLEVIDDADDLLNKPDCTLLHHRGYQRILSGSSTLHPTPETYCRQSKNFL